MTKAVVSVAGGEYVAHGLQVRREPVTTTYDDGTRSVSLGFIVCECDEYIKGAAEEIANALNAANNVPSIEHYSDRMTGTSVYPGKGTLTGLAYVGLKLNGEAGEFAEKLGKLVRDTNLSFEDRCSSIPPDRRAGMLTELGDVIWYVNEGARALGSTLRDVIEGNIAKVESRRSRGKTHGSGDDR